MYKITIEKLDAHTQIEGRLVYLTNEEAEMISAAGIKVEDRSSTYRDEDLKARSKQARIPIPDFRRVVESKIYEQIVEDLDLATIIKAANGIK